MAAMKKEQQAIRRGSTVPAYHQLAEIMKQQIESLTEAERQYPLPSEGSSRANTACRESPSGRR